MARITPRPPTYCEVCGMSRRHWEGCPADPGHLTLVDPDAPTTRYHTTGRKTA